MLKDNINIFEIDTIQRFEKVIFFSSQSPAVECIIAIHSTVIGPALGGCRIFNYQSFQTGMNDALLLAHAMTYKNTLLDLPYGGGKTIIFENNKCTIR